MSKHNSSTTETEPDEEYRHVIVDLFCGGGGFSTGLISAIIDKYRDEIARVTGLEPDEVTRDNNRVQFWLGENIKLVAVNHWDLAVETFKENHPWADVHNAKVQALHPPDAVHGHDVDILIAGPSCVPFSQAKGGMAGDDQRRMSPRHVAHWLELLRPSQYLLENVPPFRRWGPLDRSGDEPEMVPDGSLFEDWIQTLRRLGYTVDWDTFVASNYGVPQSRRRLFVMGRLNYEPEFPTPTHSSTPEASNKDPHITAADIIDWENVGDSLWEKSRPLVNNTNQRIAAGMKEYGHDALVPFAETLSSLTREDIEQMQQTAVSVSNAAQAAQERDKPFLVEGPVYLGGSATMNDKLRSMCPPQVMHGSSGGTCRPAEDEPVPTVTASGVIHYIDAELFTLPTPEDETDRPPLPSADEDNLLKSALAESGTGAPDDACLIPNYSERPGQDPRTRDIDRPLMTVPAKGTPAGISQPFMVKYSSNDGTTVAQDEVMITETTTSTLCLPDLYPYGIDIRYRMLQPRELAAAQGFPDDYSFAAETKKNMKQLVGNAVPVGLAEAMCQELLRPTDAPTLNKFGETPQPSTDETVSDD